MQPYPSTGLAGCMAVFCFRANAQVRRKQQCWTCSWCKPGSSVRVSDAIEPAQCLAVRHTTVEMKPAIVQRLRAA